jgi:hypothetical protein
LGRCAALVWAKVKTGQCKTGLGYRGPKFTGCWLENQWPAASQGSRQKRQGTKTG